MNEYLLEKLASQFSDDELEDIVAEAHGELGYDDVEKTAQDYYELGQVMALGFHDELEKQASAASKAKEALKAVRRAGGQLGAGYRGARKGERGRGASALHALKTLSKSDKKALGLAGAAGAGAAGAGGLAAYKAMKKKDQEKTSYDEGVYDTLDALGLLEDE